MFQMSKQGAVQVLSGDQPLIADHVVDITVAGGRSYGSQRVEDGARSRKHPLHG